MKTNEAWYLMATPSHRREQLGDPAEPLPQLGERGPAHLRVEVNVGAPRPGPHHLAHAVGVLCCPSASDTSCTACEVVAGYDGLEPAALSEALGSRAAGKFALAVSGTAPLTALMTFLTVRPRAAANPRLPPCRPYM